MQDNQRHPKLTLPVLKPIERVNSVRGHDKPLLVHLTCSLEGADRKATYIYATSCFHHVILALSDKLKSDHRYESGHNE